MKKTLIAFLCVLAAAPASAQAPSDEPDVALVRELLSLSGTEKQYEQVMSIMMDSIREGFSQGFLDAVREKTFDAEKQQKAQAIAGRYMNEVLDLYAAEIRKLMPYEDRKSTRLNSSHIQKSRMPSSA